MLYYILYSSKLDESHSDDVSKTIISQSESNNSRAGITGMLVKYECTFMQYIEGERELVSELYEKIKLDNRHHSVELQFEGSIEKRLFPDWSMALQILDEELFSSINSYQSLEAGNDFIQSLEDDHTNLGLKMLRYFFDLKNKLNNQAKI